jgi:hypothetical protein
MCRSVSDFREWKPGLRDSLEPVLLNQVVSDSGAVCATLS